MALDLWIPVYFMISLLVIAMIHFSGTDYVNLNGLMLNFQSKCCDTRIRRKSRDFGNQPFRSLGSKMVTMRMTLSGFFSSLIVNMHGER